MSSFHQHIMCYVQQILYHEDGSVKGIATNDVGIHKDGSPKVRILKISNNTWNFIVSLPSGQQMHSYANKVKPSAIKCKH